MADAPQEIRITAEPQWRPEQCLFRVDRTIHAGTIYVSDPEVAAEAVPLAKVLFDLDPRVKGVRIRHGELLLVLREPLQDWRELARQAGAAIRAFLQEGRQPVAEDAASRLQGADLVRHRAQEVIDQRLNPALAAHGGFVEIVDSEGNDISINMGGGCQGCGSAQATLRQGIEVALREAVPELGAIHDATDHAAGVSPYM